MHHSLLYSFVKTLLKYISTVMSVRHWRTMSKEAPVVYDGAENIPIYWIGICQIFFNSMMRNTHNYIYSVIASLQIEYQQI